MASNTTVPIKIVRFWVYLKPCNHKLNLSTKKGLERVTIFQVTIK